MRYATWSIKQIQDLVEPKEEWGEKKNIYATDSEKCPSGVYYALMGEEPTTPIDPEGLRRMDVGSMIEYNQIKKLKRLGILIEADNGQHRLENKEYGVSGRLDALIISPTQCSPEAKKIIKRKVELNQRLSDLKSNVFAGLSKYLKAEVTNDQFLEGKIKIAKMEHEIYEEIRHLNAKLLVPDLRNSLMVVEIKSISEWGFKYREREGTPMESHENQALFYLSELRKIYPNIVARVLYVQVPYQELLEFDVPWNEEKFNNLVGKWTYLREHFNKKQPPSPCPDVILNDKTGKWQVNYQAEWCRYHLKCTGDPNWKTKAMDKVRSLNLTGKVKVEPVEPKVKKTVTKTKSTRSKKK